MGQVQDLNPVTRPGSACVHGFHAKFILASVGTLYFLFGFGSEATVYEHSDWSMRAPAVETSDRMSVEQDLCRLAASAPMVPSNATRHQHQQHQRQQIEQQQLQ